MERLISFSAIFSLVTMTLSLPGNAAENKETKKAYEPQTLFKSKPTGMEKMESNTPKTVLAPHSVMIQTSLQTAINQIQGIRNQLEITSPPNPDMIDHLKMHSRAINSDLKTAMNHEILLQSQAKKFPDMAGKEDFKAMGKALDDVGAFNQGWQARISRSDYWRNKEQVKTDLDKLEKDLSSAIDKTRSFSTSALEMTPSYG